jgi:gluconolactonase
VDRRGTVTFAELVDVGASVERVASGFGFTEGPVWSDRGACLLFSDIPGDTRYRWSAAEGVCVDLRGTHKANGLALDRQGRLLSCEHATSTLARYEGGVRTVLASHFGDAELNSPNDVVVSSSGTIYFTDPPYGRGDSPHGIARPQELAFQGVFALEADPGAKPRLLADDFAKPNGLCFDAEERVLYVNDTERMHIRRFDVRPDGTLAGGEVFFVEDGDPAAGFPDGMKLDEHGNVWVCGPGGIWVVDPTGTHLGVIDVPEVAANLAWGDHDGRTLFITASTSLYRVRTRVAGLRPDTHEDERASTTSGEED